ncbi:MAG TPA: hypothetical protein VMJ75_20170 [Candidatus Acidoferrales bacterium]|nr:hypothetical protein [Candidatus Acidoferrales bacterium]
MSPFYPPVSRHDRPQEPPIGVPPAVEFGAGVARQEGAPWRAGSCAGREHRYGACVFAQARTKGFQNALLAAPEQSRKHRPIDRRGTREDGLLFRSEVVGNKSRTARLDQLEVAAQDCRAWSGGAEADAVAMTQ